MTTNIRELLFKRCGIVLPALEERHKAIALAIVNRVEADRNLMDFRALKLVLVTDNDCLLVTSHTPSRGGYTRMNIGGKRVLLHRFIYEHFVGIIPDGLLIRHLCNNSGCINPAHLEEGTHQDNANDRILAGNNICPVGLESPHAKLTKSAIKDILTKRMTRHEFSRLYRVSLRTVGNVQLGVSYKMEVEQCLST